MRDLHIVLKSLNMNLFVVYIRKKKGGGRASYDCTPCSLSYTLLVLTSAFHSSQKLHWIHAAFNERPPAFPGERIDKLCIKMAAFPVSPTAGYMICTDDANIHYHWTM